MMIKWLLDILFGEVTARQKHDAEQIRKWIEELDKDGYEIIVGRRGGISKRKKINESKTKE